MRCRPADATLLKLALALAAGFATASCGGMSPEATLASLAAGDPAQGYIGMSKSQVISCAGQPYSRYGSGSGAETMIYRYSGAGPVPRAAKPEEKKKSSIFG